MHDDLDRRVGQHRRQRAAVEVLGEWVDDRDSLSRIAVLGDRELHQAKQGAITALAHELRVERQPPRCARAGCEGLERAGSERVAHGPAPGSSHSAFSPGRPAWAEMSVACARTQRTGAEQAALLELACRPQLLLMKA